MSSATEDKKLGYCVMCRFISSSRFKCWLDRGGIFIICISKDWTSIQPIIDEIQSLPNTVNWKFSNFVNISPLLNCILFKWRKFYGTAMTVMTNAYFRRQSNTCLSIVTTFSIHDKCQTDKKNFRKLSTKWNGLLLSRFIALLREA